LSVYLGSGVDEDAYNASDGSLRWSYATPGAVDTTSVVANGVVYFGSQGNNLYALNTSDGSLLWQYTFPSSLASGVSSPAVSNGIVYITFGGVLYAFNAGNGSLLWSYQMGGITSASLAPAVANGLVYMAAIPSTESNGALYALDANTGVLIWSYTISGGSMSFVTSLATAPNGLVYFGGAVDIFGEENDYLYGLLASNGAILLQTQVTNRVLPRITYSNGMIYISTYRWGAYALNASSGSVMWYQQLSIVSSPAVSTYKTLVGTSVGYLVALSTKTGARGRSYHGGSARTPVIYKHVAYFATVDTDRLYAFDFRTWTPIWVATVSADSEITVA
jgi:outer membrane protein assembly factor BamB